MKYKTNKVEAIIWRDAFCPVIEKWRDEEEIDEFLRDTDFLVCNIGWVIHEDKDMVTISGMVSKQEAVAHIQRIPKGCIILRKKIPNPFK
jgi:hypothetical protein